MRNIRFLWVNPQVLYGYSGLCAGLLLNCTAYSEKESVPTAAIVSPLREDLETVHDSSTANGGIRVWVDKTPGRTGFIRVTLRNHLTVEVNFGLTIHASGLDQRLGHRDCGGQTLAGGEERVLEVPVDQLPIQSVGSYSIAHVEAQIEQRGQLVRSKSNVFAYEFEPQYGTAILLDSQALQARAQLLAERAGGGFAASALPFAVEGRVWKKGRFTDVKRLQAREGGQKFGPLQIVAGPEVDTSTAEFSTGNPNEPPEAVEGQWPPTSFCVRWLTTFEDADFGEDFGSNTEDGHQRVPAAYAYLRVEGKWSGFLSQYGCTPYLFLQPEQYRVSFTPQLKNSEGAEFYVTGPGSLPLGQPVVVPPSEKWQVIWVDISDFNSRQNTVAVASQALLNPDMGLAKGEHRIMIQNCPGGGTSCTQPENAGALSKIAYVGDIDRHRKFVIAHEVGHAAQMHNRAFSGTSYTSSDDKGSPACTCDGIGVEDEGDRYHCLQSRETIGTAAAEGFGHFFASKVWNKTVWRTLEEPHDGYFAYYKQLFRPDSNVVYMPPFQVNLSQAEQWRNTWCTHDANTGTEWDWLLFFWNINTSGEAIPMKRIHQIFRDACGPEGCKAARYENGQLIEPPVRIETWESLDAAAFQVLGGDVESYRQFVTSAELFGVNNNFN